nr:MAG TPA: Transcriptional regulator, contains sigma factor-related N-terminal domain [Caudoviricetes sp.]
MAELTNQQKKDYARMLYLKENLTQQEIAERVGVSRQTLSRWMGAGKWEEMKTGLTLTREQQIGELHRQVAEINRVIREREPGKRFATPAEADTLGKLAATIKKLETDVGISDLISVGMRFGDWLRPQDPEKAKEMVRLFDLFIKDSL